MLTKYCDCTDILAQTNKVLIYAKNKNTGDVNQYDHNTAELSSMFPVIFKDKEKILALDIIH